MTIEIRVLGRFSVWREGVEIPAGAFRGRLVRSLVRMLVTRRGSFVSRDLLIEALWPAGAPADPDLNLNVLVTRARSALGAPSLILTGPGGYSFAGAGACSVDAESFLDFVASGRMTDALALWGGEPLAEDAYADWAQAFRDRLNRAHLEALEGAAAAALAAGAPARAVAWARLAVAEAPLREASHLLLARALAASRDTAGAVQVLAELRGKLAEELGLDPSVETLDLETRILRGEEPGVAVATPPAASARQFGGQFGGLAFIGREAELGAILSMGEGAALVAGASGSGKSRLLAEAVARSGRRALSVRASPSERDEPWHVVRALVSAGLALDPRAADALAQLPAAALAEAVPELAALRPATGGPLDVESRRALALEGAVRFVEAAAGGDCLLAVDDLQWADASSLAVLERAADRLPAMGLILAIRPEEVAPGGPAALSLERLAALGRPLIRIDLGPLTERALSEAIADPQLVACVVEDTDGSPMAVAELVRELAARGALEPGPGGRWIAASADAHALAREAARRGQRTTIEARVDRHPPARRELLALLALLGRPVPARLLALSVGSPAGLVLGDLDTLGRAELVSAGSDGWSVAHDLIAEVVAGRMPATSRARLHEMLAGALRHEGADPSEVARHLAGAGDAPAAAGAFAEAAAQRLRRFAHWEAEQVAEAGLALGPSEEVRSSLLEVRAEARATTGDLVGAREDLRGALAGAPGGTRRSHLLTRMALLASGSEDLARASELAELAMAEAGRDPAARAEALSVAAIIDMNADRRVRAGQRSEEALELFRRAGHARGIADVLDGRAMATFLGGNIRGAAVAFDRVARLFEDSGDLLRVGTPRSTRGHALTFMARPREGLADARAALELARTLGHSEGEAYALWHCSEALSALGSPGEALEAATAALGIAERIGHREWTAASLRAVGIARQAAGDLSGAEAAFRRSLATSENLSLFAGWASARIALVLVAGGDAAGSAPHVARSLAEGPELSRYEGRLARAEVAVASGDASASQIVAEALALAEKGGHLLGARRLAELKAGL
ncbi:MAG TPA: BTAD domain-containing putative transcriptional regulator [Actinomycetota bacterium]|nr:BTAD domain-containing putative transcriptional regulator [Actinomycetota bacterium]